MNNKFLKKSVIGLFLAFPFAHANVSADYGLTLTANATINATRYIQNGTLKALFNADITAKTIEGSGTISGNEITIICDEFKFNGTISSDGKCVIYAKKPFDHSMFQRNGAGSFTVIISPHDIKKFNSDSLLAEARIILVGQSLKTAENIDANIKTIRHHASINSIDEQNVLSLLKNIVEGQAEYHKNRLDQKYDSDALKNGALTLGVGLAGIAGAYMLYKNNQLLTEKIGNYIQIDGDSVNKSAFAVAFVSALPVTMSSQSFATWLNPQHKEKYAQLNQVNTKLEAALATSWIKEEKIIKLQ